MGYQTLLNKDLLFPPSDYYLADNKMEVLHLKTLQNIKLVFIIYTPLNVHGPSQEDLDFQCHMSVSFFVFSDFS